MSATTAKPSETSGSNKKRLLLPLLVAVTLVVLAVVPLVTDDQYILDVLIRVGLWSLMAVGLNIVVAQAGLLDLGYIAFWGVGAYTTALLGSDHLGIHLPYPLALLASALVAGVFAVIIGFPTLRLRGDYLAIVTLGFGEIVRLALNNTVNLTGGPSGIQAIDPPGLGGGVQFGFELAPYFYLVLGCCCAIIAIAFWLRRGRFGLSWVALRDDELASRASGLYPLKYYLFAFAIGASFAGISGSLFATFQGTVSPDSFTVDQSFQVLAIVVLAGLSGRLWPVLVAAAVMIILPEALRTFDEYRLVFFGPALVIIVALRHNWGTISGRISSRRAERTLESSASPLTTSAAGANLNHTSSDQLDANKDAL